MKYELVDVPVLDAEGPVLILAGGSVGGDASNEIYSALHHYARKPDREKPKVVVFPGGITPSRDARGEGRDDSLQEAMKAFYEDDPGWKKILEAYRLAPILMPLTMENYLSAAYDQTNVKLLEDADAVAFMGGWQGRHIRCLLRDNGMDTPVMSAVRRVLFERNGVYFGTSAGTSIAGTYTYGTGISHADLRENRMVRVPITQHNLNPPANLDDYDDNDVDVSGFTQGLNLLPGWALDTHVDERGRYGRNLAAMQNLIADRGLCLSGATAVAIRGDWMQAYGMDRAVLFMITKAAELGASLGQEFEARDISLFSLVSGSRLDFNTGELVAELPEVSLQSARDPNHDILYRDELGRLIDRLMRSDRDDMEDESRESRPRYRFRVRKTGDSRGFERDEKSPVSATQLRLDVFPV